MNESSSKEISKIFKKDIDDESGKVLIRNPFPLIRATQRCGERFREEEKKKIFEIYFVRLIGTPNQNSNEYKQNKRADGSSIGNSSSMNH